MSCTQTHCLDRIFFSLDREECMSQIAKKRRIVFFPHRQTCTRDPLRFPTEAASPPSKIASSGGRRGGNGPLSFPLFSSRLHAAKNSRGGLFFQKVLEWFLRTSFLLPCICIKVELPYYPKFPLYVTFFKKSFLAKYAISWLNHVFPAAWSSRRPLDKVCSCSFPARTQEVPFIVMVEAGDRAPTREWGGDE